MSDKMLDTILVLSFLFVLVFLVSTAKSCSSESNCIQFGGDKAIECLKELKGDN